MDKFNQKEWIDVNEEYREYVTSSGFIYRIDNAKKFYVSPRGTHYVVTEDGVVHTLMKEAFVVCRFVDPNGISFFAPRDITKGM